ncbi:MAG TPA: lysophospholipid acyltransferase family protein [Thermoanaerobaculia bacterium]|nr:lysophospholipid acyltransferase family protein [Thermoanaerobaculia bacterium]
MDSWRYEPTADFDKTPIERLKSFPREPDLIVYALRFVTNLLIRIAMRIYHRLEIVGALPSEGSFVIVANHASHLDTAAILAAIPLKNVHRAFPAAAADYFFTNLPKLAFSAIVVNAMPFDRRENPRQSLDLCRRLLEAPGHILVLFPEGTRTVDGTLGRFKPGIGFLTAGTEFPVVPCYLDGAFRAWPKGKWMPRPRKLRLIIGEPLTFADRAPVKEDAIAIADTLRARVAALM